MDRIGEICRRAGAILIEDAAGAIGARYKDRPVGGLGDLAIFSFNGNKTVTAGGGGIVVTDNDEWADRVRHLSTQARTGRDYEHDAVGFNYRMTDIQAAIGINQFQKLDWIVGRRRALAARYTHALTHHPWLRPA